MRLISKVEGRNGTLEKRNDEKGDELVTGKKVSGHGLREFWFYIPGAVDRDYDFRPHHTRACHLGFRNSFAHCVQQWISLPNFFEDGNFA